MAKARSSTLLIGWTIAGCFVSARVLAEDEKSAALQEVIVTAEKRAENIQKVPIAVTALDSAQLENANIDTALKLDKVVPSLLLEQTNNGTITPFLRGIGSPFSQIGSEASIATYVDGVYYTRLSAILYRLNDVEQLEVLKGPQGTLFGRNATGGLINIITTEPKPGEPVDLKVNAGYSSFRTNDESLYFATGLGEKAAFSIAAIDHEQRDGWGHNVTTGADLYTDSAQAVRVKVDVLPTDTTTIRLEADYSKDNGTMGIVGHFLDHAQGNPTDGSKLPTLGFYDDRGNSPNFIDTNLYGGALKIEQDLGFATLKSIFSLRQTKQENNIDADFSAAFYQSIYLPSFGHDLQEELQLVSNTGEKLNWATGFYYMDQHQGYTPVSFTGADFLPTTGSIDNAFVSYADERVKSYAGYGQGSYEILPKTTLTLGVRYTHDEIDAFGVNAVEIPAGNAAGTFPLAAALQVPAGSVAFNKVTWHDALNYQFTPDVMGYISDSRGFKAGEFGLLPYNNVPAKPEVIDAYQVGTKSEWLNHRLRLNGALFWYDIADMQVQTIPSPGVVLISNAKKAQNKGLDFDVDAAVTHSLDLHVGFAYLHARYLDYSNGLAINPYPAPPWGNAPAVPNQNFSGHTLPRAPAETANVGASYTIPTGAYGSWALSANYAYNSGFYWQADNRLKQPSYGLLDAQVAYTLPNRGLTIRLWGSNLTAARYYENVEELAYYSGDVGFPGPPRMVGVGFEYKFKGNERLF